MYRTTPPPPTTRQRVPNNDDDDDDIHVMETQPPPADPAAAPTQTTPDNNRYNTTPPMQQQPPQPEHQGLPPPYDKVNAAATAPHDQIHPTGDGTPAMVIPLNQLTGKQPQWIDCPFCHRRAMTAVHGEGTPMQFVLGAVLCFVCVCLTCIPCLAGWFEDIEYRCSLCNNMVAVRRNNGAIEVCAPTVPVLSQYGGNQPPMNHDHRPQQQQHELHEIQPQQQQQPQPQPAQLPVKN